MSHREVGGGLCRVWLGRYPYDRQCTRGDGNRERANSSYRRAELPEVQELAQRKGLELWIVAITRSTDDSANTCPGKPELEAFFKDRPELASRVLFDECGKLLRALGGSDAVALPVTYLFGPDLKATQIQQRRAPQGRTLGQVFEAELAKLIRN